MFEQFGPALRLSILTFVLCGLAYPLAMTPIAQAAFPQQANGSLILGADGKPLGSRLVGQKFIGAQWFHGRPSAVDYQAASSGASNYGPTSRALMTRVASDTARIRAENPSWGDKPLPVDLVTASASGLDPDITPVSANLQAPRVAAARGLSLARVQTLIAAATCRRQLGFLGEPRVSVLELNLALQAVSQRH